MVGTDSDLCSPPGLVCMYTSRPTRLTISRTHRLRLWISGVLRTFLDKLYDEIMT